MRGQIARACLPSDVTAKHGLHELIACFRHHSIFRIEGLMVLMV